MLHPGWVFNERNYREDYGQEEQWPLLLQEEALCKDGRGSAAPKSIPVPWEQMELTRRQLTRQPVSSQGICDRKASVSMLFSPESRDSQRRDHFGGYKSVCFFILFYCLIYLWPINEFLNYWCWKRLRARGEGGDRGWDIWMASPTQWTWVWVDSGSWW